MNDLSKMRRPGREELRLGSKTSDSKTRGCSFHTMSQILEQPQNSQPTDQFAHPSTPLCSIFLAIKSEVGLEAEQRLLTKDIFTRQEKASTKEPFYNFSSWPKHPRETHVKTSLIILQILVIICSS